MIKTTLFLLLLTSNIALGAPASPSFEVRTAPIAFLAKWLSVDISWSPESHWSLGPSWIQYASGGPGGMLAPAYKGTALGAHLNYYVSGFNASQSVYLSAHGYTEDYDSFPHAYSGYRHNSGTKINADIGYRSMLSSRLNVMGGVGVESVSHDVDYKPDSGAPYSERSTGFYPHLEFKVGYLF